MPKACALLAKPLGVVSRAEDWDVLFDDTDFKITDGLEHHKKFKSLTIQKKEELVAYGLPVSAAPSLKENETKHVEAIDYHQRLGHERSLGSLRMMAEPNTVIIDVASAAYEINSFH